MLTLVGFIRLVVLAVLATACSAPPHLGGDPPPDCQPPTGPITVVATRPGQPRSYIYLDPGTDEWRTACDHIKSLGAAVTDAVPHHEEEWDEDTCTLTYDLGCSYKFGGKAIEVTYSFTLTEDRPGTLVGTVEAFVNGAAADVWDAKATSNPLPVLVPSSVGGGQ